MSSVKRSFETAKITPLVLVACNMEARRGREIVKPSFLRCPRPTSL